MKCIPVYSDGTNEVRFLRLDPAKGSFPGFTHRVILNRRSIGFLSENHKPSAKAAAFYVAEHGHKAPPIATGEG